jgi:hypothetical protein
MNWPLLKKGLWLAFVILLCAIAAGIVAIYYNPISAGLLFMIAVYWFSKKLK